MSATLDQPPIATADDGQVDHLGIAVGRSLKRAFRNRFSLPFARALAGGLISFGLLPLMALSRKLRHYTMFERQQMSHLAEWLRLGSGRDDAAALRDLSTTLRLRPALRAGIVLCLVAVIAMFVSELGRPLHWRGVIAATY